LNQIIDDIKEKRECFSSLEFFELLSDDEKVLLCDISTIKKYNKGEILYFEGDEINSLYYLTKGIIKIYKVDSNHNELFLYMVESGNLVSQISDFNQDIFFANALTYEPCSVIHIDYKKFLYKFSKNSKILLFFLKEFAKKTTLLQNVIERELIYSAEARLASYLLTTKYPFKKYKKKEVAYMINIKAETLSRILNKFVQSGVISVDKREIKILNSTKLKNITQD